MEIRVRYRSVDRFSQSRKFKTLKGARRYAQRWVGETPEISGAFGYAISGDGIGKVTCEGCKLTDLFPKLAGETYEEQAYQEWCEQREREEREEREARIAEAQAQEDALYAEEEEARRAELEDW